MNDQSQIIAIAELDGWLDVKEYTYKYSYAGESGELKQVQGRDPTNLGELKALKPYLTSRDAIVPVIEKYLDKMMEDETYQIFWEFAFKQYFDEYGQMGCIKATPQQLSEALLRATGKWKD